MILKDFFPYNDVAKDYKSSYAKIKRTSDNIANAKSLEDLEKNAKTAKLINAVIEHKALLHIAIENFKLKYGKLSEKILDTVSRVLLRMFYKEGMLERYKEEFYKSAREKNKCFENTIYSFLRNPSTFKSMLMDYAKNEKEKKILNIFFDKADTLDAFLIYKTIEHIILQYVYGEIEDFEKSIEKYKFIHEKLNLKKEKRDKSNQIKCKYLGVTPVRFYNWKNSPNNSKNSKKLIILNKIVDKMPLSLIQAAIQNENYKRDEDFLYSVFKRKDVEIPKRLRDFILKLDEEDLKNFLKDEEIEEFFNGE